MKSAISINSLTNEQLLVQATDVPGELLVGLKMDLPPEQRGEYHWQEHGDKALFLTGSTRGHYAVEVEWNPSEDFGTATAALLQQLTHSGAWGMARKLDWTNITARLVAGLRVAVDSRRKSDGALHLSGRLTEVVDSGADAWYITDQSIECPNRKYVMPRSKFPTIETAYDPWSTAPKPAAPPDVDVQQPDWVDTETWKYLLERGSEVFAAKF